MAEKKIKNQNIQKLLRDIKKLLILQLRVNKVKSEDIARALGVDSSAIRRMASIRKANKTKEG